MEEVLGILIAAPLWVICFKLDDILNELKNK